MSRVAAAPISWGVCEAPGWGHQVPPERVVREVREAGLRATELGPPGYLASAALAAGGLELAGGFVAAPLHRRELRAAALAGVAAAADAVAGGGGGVLVLAAAEADGYDRPEPLDDRGWSALAEGLAAAGEIAAERCLALAFHPHAGTAVERRADVRRLLEVSDVGLCLDTGHLLIGGTDPLEVVAEAGDRVRHVHLKDVDPALAHRVGRGDLAYSEAVRAGLYRPLGEGGARIAEVVRGLESSGYEGWYVLEQDTVLAAEPEAGQGPLRDVRRSVVYAERLLEGGERHGSSHQA